MAHHNILFPENFSYDASGGPAFKTAILRTSSGHERRNQNWAQPLGRWTVAHNLRQEDEIAEFIDFFMCRQGRLHTFLFKDWTDHVAAGQYLGTGDGTNRTFPLRRVYQDSAGFFYRPVNNPVAASVKVYLDGSEVTSGWSLSGASVVFDAPDPPDPVTPADGVDVTADFEYRFKVRFDTDVQSLSYETFDAFSWKGVDLVEVR